MADKTKVTLTAATQTFAAASLERLYKAATAKSFTELEAKYEKARAGLSRHVMDMACEAVKLGNGNLTVALAIFRAMCTAAEKAFKAKHKVDNVAESVSVWPVFKSNISTAMAEGLNPSDFETERELRAARDAARKAKREDEGGNARTKDGSEGGEGGEDGMGDSVAMTSNLKATLAATINTVKAWDDATQDAFAADLGKLVARYSDKAEKARKAASDAGETDEQAAEAA